MTYFPPVDEITRARFFFPRKKYFQGLFHDYSKVSRTFSLNKLPHDAISGRNKVRNKQGR
jgi:hypothetical protein